MSAPTVLVVEDNPITRKMMRVALATAGYAVLEAPDGRTALERLATHEVDLVLQDLLLPDMDGLDLIRQIRALPVGGGLPVIVVSGFLTRLEEARVSAVGFTDFVAKPVEPSRLLQTVRSYLPPLAPPADQPGAGRRVLVADDDPVQRKLLAIQLTQHGFRVVTAEDGTAALDQARREPPDAIVSDVLMPGLDGFRLCAEVRRDPRLARIPVVLTSAYFTEEADRRLATSVGANDIVPRTGNVEGVIKALLASLSGSPPAATVDGSALAEYPHRLVRQLERQISVNATLAGRSTRQAAELSALALIANALSTALDINVSLAEILLECADVGGVSRAALYLAEPDGRLVLKAQVGYPDAAAEPIASFFGHIEWLQRIIEAGEPVAIPSPAMHDEIARHILAQTGSASALVVPIVARGERLGALLMGSRTRDLSDEEWLAFVGAVAAEIGQGVSLSRTFTRLAASEETLRALIQAAPLAIMAYGPDDTVTMWNPAAERLFGWSAPEVLGRPTPFVPADQEEEARALRRRWLGGEAVTGLEARWQRRDGAIIDVSISAAPMYDATGQIHGVMGVVADISERKRAEAQLQRQRESLLQTEKLAAMGSLLAGVAHELNNPLSVVLGQAALLRHTAGDSRLGVRADKIVQAAERCARIVKNFLALARERPLERQTVSLNQVVQEAVDLLLYPLRVDNIQVTLDLARDLPTLWADPHQLHQVLVNLVTNAHQAMRQSPPPRELTLTSRFGAADQRVSLTVADTGPGIPPEIQARIFEPFFTTKPPGQGTGLGLSLCQGIVEGHRGTIGVESAPGGGAVFRIQLPVEAPPPATAEAQAREALPLIRGRILVVDDEPEVARVLADLLAADDHQVETAGSGTLALERLGTGTYDLILSDLRMPDLDGPGLYREVQHRHPDLRQRFVFLTGDTLSTEVRGFLEESGAPSLSKPFAFEEVRQIVQQALRTAQR